PEAISPNNDQINDVWNIGGIELYPAARITIYNRWGQGIWESERGYPVPWDGRHNGEDLPVDSYHFVIDLHNGMKPIVGTVTIIR
ncbi:MAG: gliding motility-associated C-terminal domain-containing protein, partial [Bacteroidales bacterium]